MVTQWATGYCTDTSTGRQAAITATNQQPQHPSYLGPAVPGYRRVPLHPRCHTSAASRNVFWGGLEQESVTRNDSRNARQRKHHGTTDSSGAPLRRKRLLRGD